MMPKPIPCYVVRVSYSFMSPCAVRVTHEVMDDPKCGTCLEQAGHMDDVVNGVPSWGVVDMGAPGNGTVFETHEEAQDLLDVWLADHKHYASLYYGLTTEVVQVNRRPVLLQELRWAEERVQQLRAQLGD